ncbi:hypothetical protein FQA47_024177 [Oryzias melastigma]|uniref:Uncharacterized protein n=1 Tax=Oryzias melastigma TaxID=30732 RepID=A0A834L1K4_ORYME|nr:hypothetical protein FQA47_024177 [Oryzias melastigma]
MQGSTPTRTAPPPLFHTLTRCCHPFMPEVQGRFPKAFFFRAGEYPSRTADRRVTEETECRRGEPSSGRSAPSAGGYCKRSGQSAADLTGRPHCPARHAGAE